MRSIARERLSYLVVRSLPLVVQFGGLVCLTPIKQYGSYPERIAGFVSLSLIAGFLNLCSRHTERWQSICAPIGARSCTKRRGQRLRADVNGLSTDRADVAHPCHRIIARWMYWVCAYERLTRSGRHRALRVQAARIRMGAARWLL